MKLALVVAMALQIWHPSIPLPPTVTDIGIEHGQPELKWVTAPGNYCDEFAYCFVRYEGRMYRLPWLCLPIPKELQ